MAENVSKFGEKYQSTELRISMNSKQKTLKNHINAQHMFLKTRYVEKILKAFRGNRHIYAETKLD